MAINDNGTRNQYTATSGQTTFAYTFEIFDKADIKVQQKVKATGVTTTLTEGTDYTVTNVGDDNGGNIVLTTGAAAGDIITLSRDMALERLNDYQQNGDFLADEVNDDYDRLWAALQQVNSGSNLAIRAPADDTALNSTNTELADPTTRAGKALGFDGSGNLAYLSGALPSANYKYFATVAAATADTSLSIGDVVRIGERADALFDVVDATTVTPNTFDIIAGVADPSIALQLRVTAKGVLADSVGAKGDGVTDDLAALQAAIDLAETLGCNVIGNPQHDYRITGGLVIDTSGTSFDLNGASLNADFTTGNAVTIGDGVSAIDTVGVFGGRIYTTQTSTSLNGVYVEKNVRRQPRLVPLRIQNFKGKGLVFEELNWSSQNLEGLLIEGCGTNLYLDDNANAVDITGGSFDGAVNYNVEIRGGVSVNFYGGYNQFAGTGGVYIDNGTVGAMQQSVSINFFGTYFEGNGTYHVNAHNGKGLTMEGCFLNCNGMTGPIINFVSWTGARIVGNTPQNTGGVDLVRSDAASTGIAVGKQHTTTLSDESVNIAGGSNESLISDAFVRTVLSLPTASLTNRGSVFLLQNGDRSRPYLCMDTASGTRNFVRLATEQRKQNATAVASPFTPNLDLYDTFDITLSTGFTINAPTGSFQDGDQFTILMKHSSGSSGAVTWDAVYKTDLGAGAANEYASVTFRYSAGRGVWIQVGKLEWTL